MSDEEKRPRRRVWEVHPLNARVDEEIASAVKTPEDTDINSQLKRIKLDRVRKMVEEAQKLDAEEVIEERRLSLEEMRAKRKELSDRRKRGDEEESETAPPQAPAKMGAEELSKLVEVSKMPPEQREEFYRAVAYTRGMYGGSGAGGESMIPLLLAFSKQNKEIGFPEMIEFSKNLMSVAKQMREESKEQGGNIDINEVVKTVLADKNKEPDSFDSFVSKLKQVEEIRNLFAPPQQTSRLADSSVEMAKIIKGHELELKKLEQQKTLEEKKISVEEKKAESFGAGLTRIATTVGAAFAAGEAEGGGAAVEHRPRRPASSGIMEFVCVKCGAPVAVPDPKPGDQATCGKCGWMHTIAEEKSEKSKKDEQDGSVN